MEKERRYKVHYTSGEEEILDPQKIIIYEYLNGNIQINGSNPSEEDIVGLVKEGKPILISKERFSSEIEKIINMAVIKNITSVVDYSCNFPG